ncbi:hypothetical protein C7S14_6385 [Burkholderia cepacia]|nr:hypothetical protein C7S14_6385 [Burkholderia cepacia]
MRARRMKRPAGIPSGIRLTGRDVPVSRGVVFQFQPGRARTCRDGGEDRKRAQGSGHGGTVNGLSGDLNTGIDAHASVCRRLAGIEICFPRLIGKRAAPGR